MTEYIERGAAIKTLIAAIHNDGFQGESNIERHELREDEIEDALLSIPAANVEPVVRCKDCVKWGMRDCKRNPCAIDISSMDEFCSDGERKAHMDERSDA